VPNLRDARTAILPAAVQVIHTFVDPSANGEGSDYCICSATYMQGHFYVVGLDHLMKSDCSNNYDAHLKAERMIIEHIRELLKRHPDAKLWLHVETNMDQTSAAGITGQMFRAFNSNTTSGRRVFALNHANSSRIVGNWGVLTTSVTKRMWATTIPRFIKNRQISFVSNFYSHRNLTLMLATLFDQLEKWTEDITPTNNDPFKKPRVEYSGKAFGKDDLALAFQGCIWQIHSCNSNHEYQSWARQYGCTTT
jgi:hypothetical protein